MTIVKSSKAQPANGVVVRRSLTTAVLVALMLACAAVVAQAASAAWGFTPGTVDATVLDSSGHFEPQAGAHPYSVTTTFEINTIPNPLHNGSFGDEFGLPVGDEGDIRTVRVEAPAGLIGNPTVTPRCSLSEFMGSNKAGEISDCPDNTQVGIVYTSINLFGNHFTLPWPLFNLQPQPGQAALFAFKALTTPVFAVPTIRYEGDYGINFNVVNIDQTVAITGSKFQFWGVPADPSHDAERGEFIFGRCGGDHTQSPPCHAGIPPRAFLTNPVDCNHGPYSVRAEVESWQGPHVDETTIFTHDDEGNPAGVEGCDRVPFEPSVDAKLSSQLASAPSGLDFQVDVPTAGLLNPEGIAQSLMKKAVVTLPKGVTLNPSAGEGMTVCTPADLEREKLQSQPGEGCPNGSRLGSVSITSPLLDAGEIVEGSLYLAQPDDPTTSEAGAENPFDSLLSLYIVARIADRGVMMKLPGKVELDPVTGQIKTTFDELPQLPFSSFKLHFREGGRSPLVTAPSCGDMTTVADLYPYSGPDHPVRVESSSPVAAGADGGACPKGGLPPFKPGLIAGSQNNAAGQFSPFYTRIFRSDEEQEITHFSIKLPPGLSAKLAGVPFCPEGAIAAAAAREHQGGGREEAADPSCPAASEIGHTLVGAGVGSVLTYVPGKVYLAGPYHGSSISIVAVTNGVVGPFDIGTVVVREALRVNPETAEVFVDATGSDPIPHIVDGVTTHIRDLRVYVDRPQFALNPTSCKRTSTASTVLGSGLDFGSEADDVPVTVSTPYQAADCAALGFKPKLSLFLKGSTRRSGVPSLRAVLNARSGDANINGAEVVLPRVEFLEQGHIRTVCTRVQFNAGSGNGEQCPAASVYGKAKAVTPLLDQPLQGPVFLRSNGGERSLPDLVAALHGDEINIDVVGFIDSVREKNAQGETFSRIRNRFKTVPDAPVSKFVLEMQGGKKGLLVNSSNICRGKHRADVKFTAHNGRVEKLRPQVKAQCGTQGAGRKGNGR